MLADQGKGVRQMDIRFWLVPPYRVQGLKTLDGGVASHPKKHSGTPRKNSTRLRASALGMEELPARAN